MNNILSKIIIFVSGAAIGSIVTYQLVKTKYDKLINEEIDSVREAYSRNFKETDDTESESETEVETKSEEDIVDKIVDKDMQDYKNIASKYTGGYTVEEKNYEDDDGEEVDYGMDKPYVISPDAFSDSEYATASFWYFEDGVLTDEDYNIIEDDDVEELIGRESLEHFGDYPDDPDTVYVRDDSLQVDYEICRDNRCYSEIE